MEVTRCETLKERWRIPRDPTCPTEAVVEEEGGPGGRMYERSYLRTTEARGLTKSEETNAETGIAGTRREGKTINRAAAGSTIEIKINLRYEKKHCHSPTETNFLAKSLRFLH